MLHPFNSHTLAQDSAALRSRPCHSLARVPGISCIFLMPVSKTCKSYSIARARKQCELRIPVAICAQVVTDNRRKSHPRQSLLPSADRRIARCFAHRPVVYNCSSNLNASSAAMLCRGYLNKSIVPDAKKAVLNALLVSALTPTPQHMAAVGITFCRVVLERLCLS